MAMGKEAAVFGAEPVRLNAYVPHDAELLLVPTVRLVDAHEKRLRFDRLRAGTLVVESLSLIHI